MRKNTIAVCASNLSEIFLSEAIQSILKTARKNGFYIQIFNSFDEIEDDSLHNRGEKYVFDLIDYSKLCGIIIFPERIKDEEVCHNIINKANELEIPVVSIDRIEENCCNIQYDYSDSFEKIVRHLVEEHNCKKFFIMGGMRNNSFSDNRINTAKEVLKEYDIYVEDDYIGYGNFWANPCLEVMDEFLKSGKELPDAFLSVNDAMAVAICDKLVEYGVKVPEETLVTGFDGLEIGRYNIPHLTTAVQNNKLGGQRAVELIKEILQKKIEKNHIENIPFELVFSQSCGCKPVIYDYTRDMRRLYDSIQGAQRFADYMDEMFETMTTVKSMNHVLECADGYANFTDEYLGYYVCLKKDKLKDDKAFYSKIQVSSDSAEDDMILYFMHDKEIYINKPLNTFNSNIILPDIDDIMEKWKAVIICPMHVQDEILGYTIYGVDESVDNYYKLSQYITTYSLIISTILSNQKMMGAYQELESAKKWIEELYIIDPLTGVLNRRGFYQQFKERVSEIDSGYFNIFSVDLDGLKYINDNYGHNEGDFAIKTISQALEKSVGINGMVSRFGGDEFVAVTYSITPSEEENNAFYYKVRSYLNLQEKTSDKPYKLSASFGYNTIKLPYDGEIDDLITEADAKMYEMKKKHHAGIDI